MPTTHKSFVLTKPEFILTKSLIKIFSILGLLVGLVVISTTKPLLKILYTILRVCLAVAFHYVLFVISPVVFAVWVTFEMTLLFAAWIMNNARESAAGMLEEESLE